MSSGLAIGLGVGGSVAFLLALAVLWFLVLHKRAGKGASLSKRKADGVSATAQPPTSTSSSAALPSPTRTPKPGSVQQQQQGRRSEVEERIESRKSRARLSVTSATGAESLWAKYGHNSDEMEPAQLKQLFQEKMGLSEAVVDSMVNLFSAGSEGGGTINKAQFEMALALLTKECSTPEEQLDACFAMFDTEKRGILSHASFEKMLQTSVNLNLEMLLSSSAGEQSFEQQARPPSPQPRLPHLWSGGIWTGHSALGVLPGG